MKYSLLNKLTTPPATVDPVNTVDPLKSPRVVQITDDELKEYNEIPSVAYEMLDQLRCYVDLAVMFDDEYADLTSAGKDEFLSNYEIVDEAPQVLLKMYMPEKKCLFNIGLDLYEFLHNCLCIRKCFACDEVNIYEITELFKNVCTNAEEVTDKFLALCMFFELVDACDGVDGCEQMQAGARGVSGADSARGIRTKINVAKLIYACGLYEMTLNAKEKEE